MPRKKDSKAKISKSARLRNKLKLSSKGNTYFSLINRGFEKNLVLSIFSFNSLILLISQKNIA